jgi:elongation factor Tu
MDQVPPTGQPFSELWMYVTDVFQIRGRGTVVTGRLDGNGQLEVGDTAMVNGMTWQVAGIEKFRATLLAAAPGENIGVLLANGPPADVLRNATLLFVPKEAFGPNAPFKRRGR